MQLVMAGEEVPVLKTAHPVCAVLPVNVQLVMRGVEVPALYMALPGDEPMPMNVQLEIMGDVPFVKMAPYSFIIVKPLMVVDYLMDITPHLLSPTACFQIIMQAFKIAWRILAIFVAMMCVMDT